jgi:hypothetical protein
MTLQLSKDEVSHQVERLKNPFGEKRKPRKIKIEGRVDVKEIKAKKE